MMSKFAAFLTLLFLCTTISADISDEDPALWITTTYPPFQAEYRKPVRLERPPINPCKYAKVGLERLPPDEEENRNYYGAMSEWCAVYDTDEKRRAYNDEEQKYDKAKAEAKKRQQDTIQEAKRKYAAKQEAARKEAARKEEEAQRQREQAKKKEEEAQRQREQDRKEEEAQRQREQARKEAEAKRDQAIKEADTYFKPPGYNSSSPTLYAGIRKLLWALKNRFDDRSSKEGQLLSDFFRKLGYIVAEIDFPQNSTSTETTSTDPISTESSVNSTQSSVNSTPVSEITTSDKPTSSLDLNTYLLAGKYGKTGLIIVLSILTLIAILILLSICLVFVLCIWVTKIVCCKKKRNLNDQNDEQRSPMKVKRQVSTMDSFSIETPLSSKRASREQEIANVQDTKADFVWTRDQPYDPRYFAKKSQADFPMDQRKSPGTPNSHK